MTFQSSPNLSAGCSQSGFSSSICVSRFQSSPNLSAGRSISLRGVYPIGQSVFNPHPASRLGAVRPDTFQSSPNLSAGCWFVVFQSSPNLSAGCWCVSILTELLVRVSILAQPFGWAQRGFSCFNPHAARRLGATS